MALGEVCYFFSTSIASYYRVAQDASVMLETLIERSLGIALPDA